MPAEGPRTPETSPSPPSVSQALTEALKAAELTPADDAAVALAHTYAAAIDEATDPERALADLGPKYLAVLTSLRMTPQARAVTDASPKGGTTANAGNPLQALRGGRAAG